MLGMSIPIPKAFVADKTNALSFAKVLNAISLSSSVSSASGYFVLSRVSE